MTHKIRLAAVLALLAAPLAADPAAGTWKTADGKSGGYLYVNIAPCGAKICGTISKAFDSSGAASPNYENLGKKLIWDMQAQGDGAYGGGKVWTPDTDKTYTGKMKLSGSTLEVKGCVAGGSICRGQDWTRVN
ncbi:MAG: DUF2147 domain-containing protein [Pseudomonadota bacterium]